MLSAVDASTIVNDDGQCALFNSIARGEESKFRSTSLTKYSLVCRVCLT